MNELKYSNPPPAELINPEDVADTHVICQNSYQSTHTMKLESTTTKTV